MTRHRLADLLVSALQNGEGVRPPTEEEFEEEVQAKCVELFLADQRRSLAKVPSLRVIPRLFVKRDFAPNSIAEHTRREARIRMLKKQESLLLEQEHLELAQQLLLQHALPVVAPEDAPSPLDAGAQDTGKAEARNWSGGARINYDGFCQVREQLPEKMSHYFEPSVFLHFPRDAQGAVSIVPIYQYMVYRDGLLRKRITLGWYDFTGAGFLRESDLDNFVQDEIANSPILSQLEKTFETFYVCTAVRMFLFFLDPGRRGKVRIKDMIRAPILDELLALRQSAVLSEAELASNWFSPASARKVYGLYLELDLDGNGMLSPNELLQYSGAMLTEALVQRVFEECQTYEGEMDFKSFLDFVLAIQNRSSRPAQLYLFRILDLRKQGYIGQFEIHYFFRYVRDLLIRHGHQPPEIEDVCDEIFDMVKPSVADRITFDDLTNSAVAETVMSLLIDMEAFYQYDNRESLIAQNSHGEPGDEHA
eukprot:Tamp_15164.p1 GENE.Tamp_15164~~Tamp_15164.p1  ORF type:complete len:494 (+),score=149.95 Tamp_15164:51-1484(+)